MDMFLRKNSKFHFGLIGLLLLIDLFLFAILDFTAIFLWIVWGSIGYFLLNKLPKGIRKINQFEQKYILVFLIVSFLGLILHFDNFNNIDLYFGFAGDDFKYYNKFKDFFKVGFQGIPEFSEVLAFLYYPYVALIGIPTLMGVLPLNWMLTSLSILLCHALFCEILNPNRISFKITVLFLLGNFVFIDAMIRFYREPLVVFFSLLAFYFIVVDKKIKSIFILPFIAILRGANFFLIGVFYLLDKVKKKSHIFLYLILFLVSIVFISKYFGTIMMYSTALSRTENMSFYQDYEPSKILESRGDFINVEEGNENSLTGNLYQSRGVLYYLTKPIIFTFFPLRLNSITQEKLFSLENKKIPAKGIFLFSIYIWFIVLLWVYAGPRMLFGMYKSFNKIRYLKYLIFFLIVLFSASFISFQQRHFLIGVIFIPFFIHLSFLYPPKKIKLILGHFLFLTSIIIYNILF